MAMAKKLYIAERVSVFFFVSDYVRAKRLCQKKKIKDRVKKRGLDLYQQECRFQEYKFNESCCLE